MPERAYLSIGEVLALLKDEFTDITISKIRFLESQGLIDPERTPSGYRKFYEPDVERLRWILRQQKEHYLPLRVIKGKLSEAPATDDGAEPEPERQAPPALAAVPDPPEEEAEEPDEPGDVDEAAVTSVAVLPEALPPVAVPAPEPRTISSGNGAVAQQAAAGRRSPPPFPESLRRSARTTPASFSSPEPPRQLREPAEVLERERRAPVEPPAPIELDPDEEVELTSDELGIVAGLPPAAVAELERYGLIKGQPGPGGRYYDAAALEIANLAAEFIRFGVEARHLRMWKTAADREADFYEQVVTPLRSQRSNKARRQAGDNVKELADLGARLHVALVAGTLKRLT